MFKSIRAAMLLVAVLLFTALPAFAQEGRSPPAPRSDAALLATLTAYDMQAKGAYCSTGSEGQVLCVQQSQDRKTSILVNFDPDGRAWSIMRTAPRTADSREQLIARYGPPSSEAMGRHGPVLLWAAAPGRLSRSAILSPLEVSVSAARFTN